MTHKTNLIFLGPPGAGKGTQAQLLAGFLQVPHISTGEILRAAIAQGTPLGQKAQRYVDEGELVPDELILGLIEERLSREDAGRGWILDGFPRNVTQASFLDELLDKLHQSPDYVVNLEVPDDVLVARLLLRGRKDDTEETVRHRLEVYQEQTAPVIDYYRNSGKFYAVDGDRSPEEIARSLKQIVSV